MSDHLLESILATRIELDVVALVTTVVGLWFDLNRNRAPLGQESPEEGGGQRVDPRKGWVGVFVIL